MKKPARWAIIAAVVVIVGAVLALSGGLPLPRSTADIVLPELEKMTGQRFSAGRMSLSIVPLFVEARDIKAVDVGGNTILSAESVKAYAALSGLVNREITLRRLVIRKPRIDVTRPVLEEIIGHVKAYLREEKERPFKVVIKSIDLSGADLSVSDASSKAAASGLSAQIILGKEPRVRLSTKDIALFRDGMPEFHGMVDTYLVVDEKNINVRNLKVLAHQTTVSTTGSLGKDDFAGQLQVEIDFFMETLKRFFGLKGPGDGRLTAKGSVKIDQIRDGLKGIILDLAVKGDFYLETLMETLKVTEPLSGSLSVDGKITGRLNDPVGEGTAVLKKGNLYTVDVDHLTCNVTYREGTMKFEKGKARLYNGSAEAEASIRLPVVDTFTLRVAVRDVDSKGIFKLINWDPGIPDGKVTGELYSSGHDFSPEGRFTYAGRTKGKDILGRVAAVSGDFNYRMSDGLIRFPRLTVASEKSQLAGEGSVNLKASSLSFTANGTSRDVADFSAPYFTALSGPASFSLSVEGPLADPLLSARFQGRSMVFMTGKLDMRDVLLDKSYAFDAFDGSVSYRRNLLKVDQAVASAGREEYRATGTVSFPEAKTLFDVAKPDYNLTIAFRNANIAAVASAFDGGPALSGAADGEFRLTGRPAALKTAGNMRALKFAYGDALTTSETSAHVRYDARKFIFSDLRFVKGRSTLAGQGTISLDKTFSFAVEGGTVDVADLVPARSMDRLKDSPVSALGFSNVRIRGEGTFADPVVDASADLRDWRYQGRSLGKGGVSASLRGKHLEGSGHLLDGKVRVKGEAELTDELPWTAFVEMQSARYDFLVEGMLKDAPEDLLINLNGTIRANGNRNHLRAVARIDRVHLTLYGNAFTNSAPVALRIEDRKLFVDNFGLRSDTTEFAVSGTTTMGKQFDLHFEGSSSLAPLRAFSKSVDVLKGNVAFVVALTGPWEKPGINGGLDITSGTLGLKSIPQRLTSLNAYIYLDEGKIVIERASGRFSGGDVTFKGTANLENFNIRRFYIESRFSDITASLSKDFWISLDGNLVFQGKGETQTLIGDVAVKRARYTERIDWKSLIFKARAPEKVQREMTKLDATQLSVKVTGSNLLIDNNLARVNVSADGLVRGTIGRPVIFGKAETREGVVYFRSREFKLIRATLDFANPKKIDPYIDVVAETSVSPYTVRLGLDGYMEKFNLTLSADPPLEEAEIFSLLTVGQTGKEVQGVQGGITTGQATSFLAGEMQGLFDERVKTITGLDRVAVDSYTSRRTGEVSPMVTVSKRLLEDKLYVTYSTSVTTGEEQIWKLEYFLSKNVSLIGLRDERGGIGSDVKFRFQFK